MAGINDYSNTAGSNTTINGIDIAEGCSPAGINNAIRQLMADIADMDDGVVPLQTPDINGGTIDGVVIGGSSTIDNSIIGGTTPAAGTFTTLTANTSITGTLNTAAQTNITSVGTLSALTVSGDLTVDTNTLYVDSTNNRVGIGIVSPSNQFHIFASGSTTLANFEADGNATIQLERSNVSLPGTSTLSVTSKGRLGISSDDFITLSAGVDGVGIAERFRVDNSEVVVNEISDDVDFRVESDNDTHALFVDGGNDRVGVGTGSPQNTLHVASSDGTVARFISSSSSGILQVGNSQTGTGTGPELRFHHNNTLGSRIISESTEDFASTGNQSAKLKFNAKSNGNNYDMVTMIPSVNGPLVGFGTTTPNATLVAYHASNNEIARFESGDEYVHIAFEDSTTTSNPYLGAQGNNFRIITGGAERLVLDGSGNFIFNENSNDVDFRVESNGNTHALFVDAGNNRVGILNSSPTQALDVTGTVKATAFQGDGSALTGISGGENTPAFKYVKTSRQTVSDNTYTKVTFDNGILDTDSAVSSSTFTVPTGKGGQYLIGANLFTVASGVTRYIYGNLFIVVNGTFRSQNNTDFRNSYYTYKHNLFVSDILDLSAGDTVEIQGRINDSTSSPHFDGDTTNYQTYFYGFKLIGA